MQYGSVANWNMIYLAFWIFFAGKFVSPAHAAATFLPFAVVVALILALRLA